MSNYTKTLICVSALVCSILLGSGIAKAASILQTTQGGTGIGGAAPYTRGDMLFASTTVLLHKLGIGTNGYVMQSNGSIPVWVSTTTLGITAGGSSSKWATSTGDLSIYPNGLVGILINYASSTITNLTTVNASSTNATTTNQAISSLSSAIVTVDALGITKEFAGTSCTNQFVRALSALGVATCAQVSLTLDVTGTLPVANGGTGQTVFRQGWLHSDGATVTASSSPTVNYIVATSTTASNSFAGNVGIGDTTPSSLLTVGAGDAFRVGSDGQASTTSRVTAQKGFSVSGVNAYASVNNAPIYGIGYSDLAIDGEANNATQMSGYYGLSFVTGSASGSAVPRMVVTRSGKVGIGTTTPFALLSVSDVAGTNAFVIGSSTNSTFLIDDVGRVSVGTSTSPGAHLDINNRISPKFRLSKSSTAFYEMTDINGIFYLGFRGQSSNITSNYAFGVDGGGSYISNARLVIPGTAMSNIRFAGGNIGFGTSTPKWQLHAASTSPTSLALSDMNAGANAKHWLFTSMGGDLRIGTSTDAVSGTYDATTASTTYLTIKNGGNVGIGTTSPFAKLSIHSFADATFNRYLFAVASSTASATSTLFSINSSGGITLTATQPATSTSMVLDWANTGSQVEYRIGTSATTIYLINATSSDQWGSTKRVWVCNPGGTAGALTWVGPEWIGTAPTQTTTANECDIWTFNVTRATSTTGYKVAGSQGAGFK